MASSTKSNMYPGIDAFLYPNTLKSPTGQFAINLPGTLSGGVTVPAPQMGPGNVLYQSELIRQLREANKNPMTNNPGVTLLDNPKNSTLVLDFNKPVPKNMANRPPVLKITPTTPTPPGGDNNTKGGGGGGGDGPIVIGPGGGGSTIVIGGGGGIPLDPDDGTDPDPWDPENDGDDSWSEWTGTDDTATGSDNKDASVELKAGDNIVVEGDGIIDFPDTDGVGDVPDYTDDLWGDDVVDVPDYTNDLWGDLGGIDFFDPVYDFNFGWDGFDAGGFSGGGGGGGGSGLLHQFMLE